MVDIYIEIRTNGIDETVGVFRAVRSVDAVAVIAVSNFYVQVTWKGQHCGLVIFWINANEHDAVGEACIVRPVLEFIGRR